MEFLKKLQQFISSKRITHTLLNLMIVLVIILLIITTNDLWIGLLNMIWLVSRPFIVGFTIAFVLNPFINFIDKYLDATIDVLNQVLVNLTNFIIYVILAIYMSNIFNSIRQTIKNIAIKIDCNLPIYLKEIDLSLVQYVKAFFIGAIAQAITTMIMYVLIGHPNWLILGVVSGVSSIIPYVGPIIANCLGLITSLGMQSSTIIFLCILIFIQSIVMSYIITPRIYSSRIDLSILWVLFGILSGSSLFGIVGMIIAMPLLVSIKIIYQVYKEHHQDKLSY